LIGDLKSGRKVVEVGDDLNKEIRKCVVVL